MTSDRTRSTSEELSSSAIDLDRLRDEQRADDYYKAELENERKVSAKLVDMVQNLQEALNAEKAIRVRLSSEPAGSGEPQAKLEEKDRIIEEVTENLNSRTASVKNLEAEVTSLKAKLEDAATSLMALQRSERKRKRGADEDLDKEDLRKVIKHQRKKVEALQSHIRGLTGGNYFEVKVEDFDEDTEALEARLVELSPADELLETDGSQVADAAILHQMLEQGSAVVLDEHSPFNPRTTRTFRDRPDIPSATDLQLVVGFDAEGNTVLADVTKVPASLTEKIAGDLTQWTKRAARVDDLNHKWLDGSWKSSNCASCRVYIVSKATYGVYGVSKNFATEACRSCIAKRHFCARKCGRKAALQVLPLPADMRTNIHPHDERYWKVAERNS